jgi:hypothetical protein
MILDPSPHVYTPSPSPAPPPPRAAVDPARLAEVLWPHQAPYPQSSVCGRYLIAPTTGPDPDPDRLAADDLPAHVWAEVGR